MFANKYTLLVKSHIDHYVLPTYLLHGTESFLRS